MSVKVIYATVNGVINEEDWSRRRASISLGQLTMDCDCICDINYDLLKLKRYVTFRRINDNLDTIGNLFLVTKTGGTRVAIDDCEVPGGTEIVESHNGTQTLEVTSPHMNSFLVS